MTDPDRVPPPAGLGPAGAHRAAADTAAARQDFDVALRERFRAVLRGLEQGGALPVRRSRTARETAADAARLVELSDAAASFDEVVYGGRTATPDEYRRLAESDRFSQAPPPPPEPAELAAPGDRPRRARRTLPALPGSRRFWLTLLAVVLAALVVLLLIRLAGAPHAPPVPDPAPHPPPTSPTPKPTPPPRDHDWGAGDDSIFGRWPPWIAFGGLQWLLCAAVVVWWRARRRGALVGEPLPVEAPAHELLAGHAALYRRANDPDHVAAILRAATLRRIRPTLDLPAGAPPPRVIDAIARRTGLSPTHLGATLFGPVPDTATLTAVAGHLLVIETELDRNRDHRANPVRRDPARPATEAI
ncbi:DUF4129 domain-containing protein [Nocardia aurantia]|uniref:Protein-glutamine gamma-glutamyltransferase-like C-terminal domain-containing protein n=1 Tax=Nocardia aurantia TaxID=2585199 RepID=A0A7K0DMT6_9NOCA|nr:DUF4129 domain-containing protein [Nocardia aurantia]MQY26977.1 hypothetical protein [Nocardia aurantia]